MAKKFLTPIRHAVLASAPASPSQGDEYFDSTLNQLRVWDGTQWVNEGAGGGGGTTYNQYAMFFEKVGPATYATGGFVVDLRGTFSSINRFKLIPKKGARGNMPWGRLRYRLNVPTAGQVTVLMQRYTYDKATSIGNVSGQPSGVTIQSGAGGGASSSESSHFHFAGHGHGETTATPTAGGAGSISNPLGPALSAHQHAIDVPTLNFNTAAGAAHNHTDNTLYAHGHAITETLTEPAITELVNGSTALATTTFYGAAFGVRA